MTMNRGSGFDSEPHGRFPIPQVAFESNTGPEEEVSKEDIRGCDVLLGRGKSYTKHPGIIRFQSIINQNIDRYFAVSTHQEKKDITEEIVKEIEKRGRFLRYDSKRKTWLRINHDTARTKVAQAIQYRQRRRANGYDISSIEGSSNLLEESQGCQPSRKRRSSSPDSPKPCRPRLTTSSSEPAINLLQSHNFLAVNGTRLLNSSSQRRWDAEGSGSAAPLPLLSHQRTTNNLLSQKQSLDMALSQMQLRQQDDMERIQQDQHQQGTFPVSRSLPVDLRLLPYMPPTMPPFQGSTGMSQTATLRDNLEPLQFDPLTSTQAASLPAIAMIPNPTDPMWQIQMLQAIQQQNAAFAGQQRVGLGGNSGIEGNSRSSHSHQPHQQSRPLPTAAQPQEQDPQTEPSSSLDPLPFEIEAEPVPIMSQSTVWVESRSNEDGGTDEERKPSPRNYPL